MRVMLDFSKILLSFIIVTRGNVANEILFQNVSNFFKSSFVQNTRFLSPLRRKKWFL